MQNETLVTRQVEDYFIEFEQKAQEWSQIASTLKVTDESQVKEMEQAKEARLALRDIRIAVEKKHKELKEESLRKGQILDMIKRKLIGMIEPTEVYLLEQSDFVKIQEKKKKDELFKIRCEALYPFVGEQAKLMQLQEMDQDVFATIVLGYETAKKEREEKEKIEQSERLEKERLEKEAIQKAKIENERLAKENQILLDKQKAEKQKADEKLKLERAERKRLEDELLAKKEKEEQEQKAKLAAERKAKRAPDKEKLLQLASNIDSITIPDLKDEQSKFVGTQVKELLEKVIKFINSKCESL